MRSASLARAVLEPGSIALVGVSRDSSRVSGLALPYLRRAGFAGDVYLVNPSITDAVPGVHVVPDVRHVPEGVDLAFVSVSAERTPHIVSGLSDRGAGAVVVGASGFSELGPEGARLEAELADAVAGGATRLIGPNCNGLYAVQSGVALGFNRSHGRTYTPGGIAIISQSGALIGAIADLCASAGAGLRGFYSTGNELDVKLVDLLEILATDAETTVIALVLDRVGDPTRFRAACRLAARNGKRVLAFKFGNTAAGRKASESHSARMAGDSATYDALFEGAGVTRCASLTELAITAALLESRPAPTRPGALVISTSGAGGALTVDAIEQRGIPLVPLGRQVEQELASTLRFVKPGNPVDVGAGGSANALANFAALRPAAEGTCTVFFYLPPPTPEFAQEYSRGFAELVGSGSRGHSIGLAVMIDRTDQDLVDEWLAAGIPVVSSIDEAAAIVSHLQPATSEAPADVGEAVDANVLGEAASARIAAAAGIPFPTAETAADAAAAAAAADRMGYPVVLKGVPDGVAHKSAAGLVVLGLAERSAVERAADAVLERMRALGVPGDTAPVLIAEQVPEGTDLIVAVKRDPEFGVLGVLGLGGATAEARGAFRVLFAPFETRDVRSALDRLGVTGQLALQGVDVEVAAARLTPMLRGLAEVLDAEALAEFEINPLRVLPGRAIALDALATRLTGEGVER